jgi:hypothetical protein
MSRRSILLQNRYCLQVSLLGIDVGDDDEVWPDASFSHTDHHPGRVLAHAPAEDQGGVF